MPLRRSGWVVLFSCLGAILSGSISSQAQVIQTNLAAIVRHAPSLNGSGLIQGSLQQLLGENLTINGGFVMTGDLLEPGTPTLLLNGNPTFAGTITGSGSASPNGYQVTLNGNCSLHYLRTRTTPVTLPTVTSPPQPTGTRIVTITAAGQSIGTPATLKNLTLNGNVGQIAVPPGTYGDFTANGGSGFTLGVAGATNPAVYNLQNLTLNGNTHVDIVGPIILKLANGFSANGLLGTTNQSAWLQVQIASGGFTLNGGCTVHGNLTVPAGTVIVNGNSLLVGTVQCDRLTVNSGGIIRAGTSANQPPTANNQSITVTEDGSVNITLTGSDPEGASLTTTLLTQPAHGTLTGTAPNVVYHPAGNFTGADSFTFKVNDGQADSAAATVAITVTPVNDPPTALPQTLSTPEDTPLNITLTGSDIENNTLTFQVVTSPTHGTLSGTAPNLTYTPSTNYNGPDHFTFRANDGQSYSAAATVSITVEPVDDAPVANIQSVTGTEDTAFAITLTGGDIEGESLTYILLTSPSHGTLNVAPGTLGSPLVVYTPATNYFGPDSFTFEVNDSTLNSQPATVALTIQPVNDAPIASPQTVTTLEDTATNIVLTGTDVEGDALTYQIVTSPAHGTLHGTPPQLVYSPAENYNGADSFTFLVNDGTTNSAPTTVSLNITPVNDAPIANAAAVSTGEDTPLAITLTATDVDGDPLTYSIVTPPAHGTLSGSAPGLTYTPATNYNGADSFTFVANDGQTNSLPAEVTLTINPVNDAPVANAQSVSTDEDTALAITLIASDVENDPLTFTITTQPQHGTLTGTSSNLVYLPSTNYHGNDSFAFSANDGQTNSAPATVTITVNAVNDAPEATAQSITTPEDVPASVTLSGSDVDGDALTFSVVTPPSHGTLSGTPPNLTYSPAPNYFGDDAFLFTASDSSLTSQPAVVTLHVTPVNDPPIAAPQSVATDEDTAIAITLAGTDADGDTLTFQIVDAPTHGVLTGTAPNLTYTPAANYHGGDSFTFRVNDGHVNSAVATVSITVNSVNDAPVAAAQSVSTDEDTPVAITLTGSDVDGDALTFQIVTSPIYGTLTGTAPNLTYTPAANYHGGDLFRFRVNDGHTNSATATVTITVNSVNDAPVAAAQSVSTDEDTSVAITLAGSDVDGDALTFQVVNSPAHGTLSGSAPNLTYTPATNFNGADSFTFKANDGQTNSQPATISITVNPINDAPVAQNLTIHASGIQPVNGTLVATDVDGDTLTFTLQAPGSKGTAVVNANGSFVYTPQSGATGTDSFTFSVTDGQASATGTVTVTLSSSANHRPVASAKTVTVDEDTPVTITLHGTDADNDPLTFEVVDSPVNGTIDPVNFIYTPAANFSGTDSFTFVANDGTTSSAPATVSITITAVNDPPQLTVPGTQTLVPGRGISFDYYLPISISDVDHNGGQMKLSLSATNGTLFFDIFGGMDLGITWISDVDNPTNPVVMGTLDGLNSLLHGWGHLNYTSASNFPGDVITITIDDMGNTGAGGPQSDTKTIQIIAANVAPFVTVTAPAPQSQFTIGQPIPITVTAGDVNGGLGPVKLYVDDVQLAEWPEPPYEFVLTNAALGDHVFYATAIDDHDAETLSASVTVSVVEPGSGDFTVNAGADQSVEISHSALLNGTVDIPAPVPGNETNVTWSLVSGPGSVQFSNPDSLTTSATFSDPGSYTLILHAAYGGGTRSDTIVVNVLPMVPQRLVAARSSKGTDFWLTFLFQPAGSDYGIFNRVMIAADTDTDVKLINAGFAFGDSWREVTNYIHVAAGTVAVVPINSPTGYGVDPINNIIASNTVHLSASAPVTVHGFTRDGYTADGFLALPTAMLSTNYLVMSYSGGSDFALLATEDDTHITIIPSSNIAERPASQPWNFVMQRGQSYRVATYEGDFTGTAIKSDKPIVVMGGAVSPYVPPGFCCADHLCEQMTPINMWGQHFVSLPLATRSGGDTFRFLASEDHTSVSVNGTVVAMLNHAQFYEQIISNSAVILSSKPILVAQFANGSTYDNTTGDPFLSLVPPVEQFGGDYLMDALTLAGSRHYWEEPGWTYWGGYDPSNPGIEYSSYVNLIVYGDGTNSISIDGSLLPGDAFQAIGDSGYFGAQLPLSNTVHHVTGPVPIGGLVYGWATYESYAFAGGLYAESVESDTQLQLTQTTAYSAVGGVKSVFARITNGRGLPIADIDLPFLVTGAHTIAGRIKTSRFGEAVFTYTGTNTGVDVITARLPGLEKSVTNTWITTDDNLPPVVSTANTLPVQAGLVLQLRGTVTDDGRPAGASLNVHWRLLDGPGTVVFQDATQPETSATCSEPGIYRFELTADDSQFSSQNIIAVTASFAPGLQFPAQEIPAVVPLGTPVAVAANAGDADGSIQRLEFYANGALIGSATNQPNYLSDSANAFGATITWTPPTNGVYELRAIVYDLSGLSTTSDPFSFLVSSAPLVAIDNITNGTVVNVPTNVLIHAIASDPDGTITSLTVYLNGEVFGTSSSGDLSVTWTPRRKGDYTFSATAIDDVGLTTTSDNVTVTVSGAFPQIVITNPVPDGFAYSTFTGKPFQIAADASIAAPYTITNVVFSLWGGFTTNFTQPPYETEFTPTGGNVYYQIIAEAYADSGAIGTADPVYVYAQADASIAFEEPVDGQSFIVGQPVRLRLSLYDPWNILAGNVFDFWANGQYIGQSTNHEDIYWTPPAPGGYTLYAEGSPFHFRAWDTAYATSAIAPESIAISSPHDGDTIYTGVPTPLSVTLADPLGAFDHVEFFANGDSVGITTNTTLYWTATETSDYVLTASVTDRYGQAYGTQNPVTVHAMTPPLAEVSITDPGDGGRLPLGKKTFVQVEVTDPGMTVTNVELRVDGMTVADITSPYLAWTPIGTGSNVLEAVAADFLGNSITSAPIHVVVADMHPPVVTILSPTNGERMVAGTTPLLRAQASDPDGTVVALSITLDQTVLYRSNNVILETVATNITYGWHEVSAQALDNDLQTASSETVRFYIERGENLGLPVPDQLTAEALSPYDVRLQWQPINTNESTRGLIIERWDETNSLWVELAELAVTETDYTNTDLEPETSYRYRAAVFDSAGSRSAYSAEATVTTRAVVPAFAVIDLDDLISSALTNRMLVGNILTNPGLTHFDVRRTIPGGTARDMILGTNAPAFRRAVARFKEEWPQIQLDYDPIVLSPKSILPRAGFLTGPGGSGITVSEATAQMFDPSDPYRPIKAFVQEQSALFGFGAEALSNAAVQRDYISAGNGARTVVWQQQVGGLPVFQTLFVGHITATGELAAVASEFIPDPAQATDPAIVALVQSGGALPLSSTQAVLAAVTNIGDIFTAGDLITSNDAQGIARTQVFTGTKGIKGDGHAELTWFPASRNELKLAWQVIFTSQWRNEMYLTLVSAETGEILYRRNLTADSSDATYRVYTDRSPAPMSPGWPAPNSTQAPLGTRSLVTFASLDTNASPAGWINDGDNETRGNNVDAHLDRNDDNQSDLPRPTGSPARVFDFPLDLSAGPASYGPAATVQLFYWVNWMHDALYGFGFTEAAGNFQANNFGRGGVGGDPVLADSQDGLDLNDGMHRNNANMSTPPDGFAPRMQMYSFIGATPDRDGSLDAEIVLHEYTHGLSARLVGGGIGMDSVQAAGMSEGWSDYLALAMLTDPAADPDAVYPMGAYVTYHGFGTAFDQNYYFGIRRYPYCTDTNKNPLTFGDIDPAKASAHAGVARNPLEGPFDAATAGEVHAQGEVWCTMLWEMRANLIRKYGSTQGNSLAIQLVVDGLKLSPPNPNFIQARDAILLADRMWSHGANAPEIWAAFSKRGLGYDAKCPESYTTSGVQESHSLAPALLTERVMIQGGNGDGVVESDEDNNVLVVLHNQGTGASTQISGHIYTTTPGVTLLQDGSSYPDIPQNESRSNDLVLQIRTLPEFVEGTPIDLIFVVASAQTTITNQLRLFTGTPGADIEFENYSSLAGPIAPLSGLQNLTPLELNNLEPLWMADDGSCLLKGGVNKYVLWRFGKVPLPIEDPRFLAHRLTRGGEVVGSITEPTTRDEFEDILSHTWGAKWDLQANTPIRLTANEYHWPKNGPLPVNVGIASTLLTSTTEPGILGPVTHYPTLQDVWDLNRLGTAVGSVSVQELFSLQRIFFSADGTMNWFTPSERGLDAGPGLSAARQVDYEALITTAAQFDTLTDWRWLGPLTLQNSAAIAQLVNDSGMIAGYGGVFLNDPAADYYRPSHAFRAQSGEFDGVTLQLTDIGVLEGGLHSMPRAMNASGQLVGFSDYFAISLSGVNYDQRKTHGVFWNTNSSAPVDLRSLEQLLPIYYPAGYSDAYAINDAQQIVGTSLQADNESVGVFWQLNHNKKGAEEFFEITDLNTRLADPSWHVMKAVGINNDGLILATAQRAHVGPEGQVVQERKAVILVPINMRMTLRDDLRKTWADNQLASRPVYSGKTTGDMVSWKAGGSDAWTDATFTWTATGPETITGPSGVGKNEWRIADGDDDTAVDWIKWKPGHYKIKCVITFSGGGGIVLESEQEVGVRTDDVLVVGWIDRAQVPTPNPAGIQSGLVEVLPPGGLKQTDGDNAKIKAGLLFQQISQTGADTAFEVDLGLLMIGVDFVPFTAADKTYTLNWMFKYADNAHPEPDFADKIQIGNNPNIFVFNKQKLKDYVSENNKTRYKLINHYQVRFLVQDDHTFKPGTVVTLAAEVETGNTKDPARIYEAWGLFDSLGKWWNNYPADGAFPGQPGSRNSNTPVTTTTTMQLRNEGRPDQRALDAFIHLTGYDQGEIWSSITFFSDPQYYSETISPSTGKSLTRDPKPAEPSQGRINTQVYPTYWIYINGEKVGVQTQAPSPSALFPNTDRCE